MLWESWIRSHKARRNELLEAAPALLAGDFGPARSLLKTWRFSVSPELVDRLLVELIAGVESPDAGQLTAIVGDPEAIPHPPEGWFDLPPLDQRSTLAKLCPPSVEPSTEACVAWAIDELAFFGDEIDRQQRRPWLAMHFKSDPEKDKLCALLWEEWFKGAAWNGREAWEKLYLPVALRAFRAVLEARQFPEHVRYQVQEDLQEAFFFTLLGGSEGPPGWQELAVRVLETEGEGPIDALTGCLDASGWDRVGRCAVRRGHGPRTANLVWPDLPNALARSRVLTDSSESEPATLERLLDLHVALRLVDSWKEPDHCSSRRSWRVVLQNRGRASGRLRAVLAGTDAAILREPMFALGSLHARTVAAISRHCRDWAWQQVSRGFSFDYSRNVNPVCVEPPEGLPPFGPEEHAALRAWVILVILRDRLPHLQRWSRTGSTGDRDTQWGRLLAQALPDQLRDPESGVRSRYERMRAELSEGLDDLLGEIWAIVEGVAELDENARGRGLGDCFNEIVVPVWHDSVPMPRVRYRGYISNARKALGQMRTAQEEPSHDR